MNTIDFINNDNEEKHYLVKTDILLSSEDKCCYISDENENEILPTDKIFRIKLKLPKEIFDPITINVDIPKELLQDQKGLIEEIQVPISIDDGLKNITIKESVKKSNSTLRTGVIGMLKRAIEFLDTESEGDNK